MCLSVREYEISSDFNSKFGREADFSDDLPANFYRESGVKSDPSPLSSLQYWDEASGQGSRKYFLDAILNL